MFLRALSPLPRNLPALTLPGQCYSSRTARADILVSKDPQVSVTAGRELLLIILAVDHPPVQLLRADAFNIGDSPPWSEQPAHPNSFETCRSVNADGACSVNATLYTKYDDCLIGALRGIVNKSDSVSGNRTPARVYFTTAQSSGADPSRPVLLLPHSESRYVK